MVAAEGEHREGDEGVGGSEAERDPGDQADLGVDRLDAPVGQAVLDRGEDRRLVFDDAALQVDERRDAAAAGPADPGLECLDGLVVGKLEDGSQAFFERVGAVQPGVGLGDPGQLGPLAGVRFSGFFYSA